MISPSVQGKPASAPVQQKAATSLHERFAGVLRPSNYFESAAKALAVIDAMTSEDFRELRRTPSHFPVPSSYGFDSEFEDALMDALIARWLVVDPSGAPEAIRAVEAEVKKKHMAGTAKFAGALARLKPEAILDALPEEASWERSDYIIPTALTALSQRDEAAARIYLQRVTDPELRKSAELAIGKGIAKNDPVAAVTLAHTMESQELFGAAIIEAERIGDGILRQVLSANTGKLPIGHRLLELMFRFPEEDWAAFVSDGDVTSPGVSMEALEEAPRLTPDKRTALLGQVERLPDALRSKVTEALIFGWAREEPEAALEWAFAQANPMEATATETTRVGAAFYPWMRSDEEAAVAWWSRLPESPLRSLLGNGIALNVAARGEYERALTLFQPIPGKEAELAVSTIAGAGAKRDPAAAAQWLNGLKPEIDIGKAAGPLLKEWIARDAAAAASWVEAQPAGARRDALVHAYAMEAAEIDPATAGEWASTISDPKTRLIAAEHVFRQMSQQDVTKAQTWLRAFPGADAAWCERLIRLRP